MNLPNTLTVIRILLVPVLVVILMTRVPHHNIIGSVVFWIACVTDFYDGYFARKLRQITVLGKLLDPLADKLLISGALLSLVELGLTPAWMAFIILAREMAITGLRGLASEEGLTIAADWLGKWKLGAQIAAISCLLFGPVLDGWIYALTSVEVFHHWGFAEFFRGKLSTTQPWGVFAGLGLFLMWVAMILAIWSAITYAQAFWRNLGNKLINGRGRLTGTKDGDEP
ncbi:MAG: CDP-diacylglycerol--glycerol-3-phosphate 3-phosphatidyltransferase [Holophagales bacterium]|jgi:CDP-diacylglycerol--glycerol-3-phosphate 3-phosphatidyltransferase|nr:CDP-diacylglycerol--glycerol-3-phosphate 3-phosphatidyltransferase [Holophagales bacterium]